MSSSSRHIFLLASFAILWLVGLTVASSAAPPPAAPVPAAPALPPTTLGVQAGAGAQRPTVTRPAATIGGQSRPLVAKPFANHVQRSPVSPYLNLFRGDNAGGTIDNYSTLVKPLLQQQRMNQEIMRNKYRLNTMEPSLLRNESSLARIRRQTQILEGRTPTTRTSSRFMNYGGRFGQR